MALDIGTDIDLLEIGGVLAIVALIAYFVYQAISKVTDLGQKDITNGGSKEGLLGNITNDTLTIGQGGGTYTDAAGQVLTSPWGSFKSIVGWE